MQWESWAKFSVESNTRLHYICLSLHFDWSRKLSPFYGSSYAPCDVPFLLIGFCDSFRWSGITTFIGRRFMTVSYYLPLKKSKKRHQPRRNKSKQKIIHKHKNPEEHKERQEQTEIRKKHGLCRIFWKKIQQNIIWIHDFEKRVNYPDTLS